MFQSKTQKLTEIDFLNKMGSFLKIDWRTKVQSKWLILYCEFLAYQFGRKCWVWAQLLLLTVKGNSKRSFLLKLQYCSPCHIENIHVWFQLSC